MTQLGERFERLVQIIQRADQRRVRSGLRRHQADRAAAQAFVQQQRARRGGRPLQHQPGQPVAQFGGQHDRDFGVRRPWRHMPGGPGQAAAVAALRQHGDIRPGAGQRRHAGHQAVRLGTGGEHDPGVRGGGRHFRHRPGGGQREGEGVIPRRSKPVGEIHDRPRGTFQRAGGAHPVWRPRQRMHRRQTRPQLSHRHGGGEGRGGILAGARRGQQGRLAPGPLGLVQRAIGRRHPGAPIRRRRPAIVHHQQQRAIPRQRARRVQHRPGQPDDKERRRDGPQQQQPPGRARRRLLLPAQSEQQPHGGEILHPRRRGCHAQQPPQRRQHEQGAQHPGRREDHATPESAVYNPSRAEPGGASVRCVANPQPAARQSAASPACCAASASA